MSQVKLVVVGDGAIGKTCLLVVYAKGTFPEQYIPTVFENYTKNVNHPDHGDVSLALWDTAGQEEFDQIRPLSYSGSDIVFICFSLVDEDSLDNTRDKWLPEVQEHLSEVSIFLVGLKADLRDEMPDQAVPTERGEALVGDLGASQYWEVSAKAHMNVDELFNAAIDVVLKKRKGAGSAQAAADAPAQTPANNTAQSSDSAKGGCCTLL